MATKKRAPKTEPTVEAFLAALGHPLDAELHLVRGWILAISPGVSEAIKWNAPSFRTSEFFATFHLRSRDAVRLVLHTGARAKASAKAGLAVEVPAGLSLRWLARDRALLTLPPGAALKKQRGAVESLLRQWVAALG